ncbi:large ribosomal subunit protein mL44 [Hydra vulgaris]|uniref:Large ribosomal subunit protein mL44 n=1 Tax=Hydra vulgaris TaxID=6087 RepID=A0ABM4CXS6_HYDVU
MANIVHARILSHIFGKVNVATFKSCFPLTSEVLSKRSYKGSNRYKRMKGIRDKERLDKEMQQKYGINKPQFNFNNWMKNNYLNEIKAFQFRLNTHFKDEGLMISALCHSSFVDELKLFNEHLVTSNKLGKNFEDNDFQKRLDLKNLMSNISSEKLALVGMELSISVIKTVLYKRFPNLTVHACNDITNFLISRNNIVHLAKNLSIKELLLLSKENENQDLNDQFYTNFVKEDFISDAFFALIGAIEIDQGYNASKKFVEDFVVALIDQEELSKYIKLENPKQELESILQMHGIFCKPVARVIAETGISTDFPFYYVGIYCDKFKIGEGSGYSIRTGINDAFKNCVFKCFDQEVDFKAIQQSLI